MILAKGSSRNSVWDGAAALSGALMAELGVVFRLRDCLLSRPLVLVLLPMGAIASRKCVSSKPSPFVASPRAQGGASEPRDEKVVTLRAWSQINHSSFRHCGDGLRRIWLGASAEIILALPELVRRFHSGLADDSLTW